MTLSGACCVYIGHCRMQTFLRMVSHLTNEPVGFEGIRESITSKVYLKRGEREERKSEHGVVS